MAARQPAGVLWNRPSRSGASTAQPAAPTLASVSARSRRSPCWSDRIAWVQVSTVVPAKPSTTAPSMVNATVREAANRPAPAVAPAAEHHSSAARRSRRASGAKATPASAAPAAHSAE